MTAHERENRQETPSMRELLESCAAADAVSTPPAAEGESGAGYVSAAAVLSVPDQRPAEPARSDSARPDAGTDQDAA